MKIDSTYKSPFFSDHEIPVDFLILHYTACDLKQTLEIFTSSDRKVCAHFVLDTDGTIYDLGGFIDGPIRQGAHAGKSQLELNGKSYASFNQFSIGIEIINLNGNLLEYTEEQYTSLAQLVRHLQSRFPALKNPERIMGHEHLAYWRGKADPGVLFDWSKFFASVDLKPAKIHSVFACNNEDIQWLNSQKPVKDWSLLSSELEARIADRMSKQKLK